MYWLFLGCIFASPFFPKDQASHPSFGSNMQLQQHEQLSVPRTWAFGWAESHSQRWHPPSGQGISEKIIEVWAQAHGKVFATTEVLDTSKSGTCKAWRSLHLATEIHQQACGLRFSNNDCKALYTATGCSSKETNFAMQIKQVNLRTFLPSLIMLCHSKVQG